MTDAAQTPSFGIRLRQLRRAAGLKQITLAKRSGLSRSLVALIETGRRGKRPDFSTVQRLTPAPSEIIKGDFRGRPA